MRHALEGRGASLARALRARACEPSRLDAPSPSTAGAAPAAPPLSAHPRNRLGPFVEPSRGSTRRSAAKPSPYFHALHLVQRSSLRGAVRLVAFSVVWYGNLQPSNPNLCASLETLSHETGLSRSTVQRALRALQALGLLVRDAVGDCHGQSAGAPVRYRVRWDALERATSTGADALVSPSRGRSQGRGGAGHGDLQARKQGNTEECLLPPTSPPSGGDAPGAVGRKEDSRSAEPEGNPDACTESRAPRGVGGLRSRNRSIVARGMATDAAPIEDAAAGLYEVGFRGDCQALAEAAGVEACSDVVQRMRRKRARNGGGLVVHLFRTDYPEAWAVYEAGKRAKGSRGNRLRQRDAELGGAL